MSTLPLARSFDDLSNTPLDQIYQQGREEVLRDHAFRILLARADTVAKLEPLAFASEQGLAGWTTKERIEISNRFRLLSSPENEIRLYRECQDEAFRCAPRVREFYVLALNKVGRPAEAILEISRLIAEGGQNALLWGTLGEAYTARMLFAEQLTLALIAANDDATAIEPSVLAQCSGYFPTIPLADLTIARVQALREENLRAATRLFHHGFRESGSSFTGLGWLLRTLDHRADLISERQRLQRKNRTSRLDGDEALRLRLADNEVLALEQTMTNQVRLIEVALALQGGAESLDYWTRAGILLCTVLQGANQGALRAALVQLFSVVDAAFKLTTTIIELQRIHDQSVAIHQATHPHRDNDAALPLSIKGAAFAMAECKAARARFKSTGKAMYPEPQSRAPEDNQQKALNAFLEKTVNFRALTGNLVPLCISGAIGRVEARVPDLLINRQVQEDLADLVETKVLQALPPTDRENPRAVIARIQQVVGAGLKVSDLQDLQSPAHVAFDTRSDGLIALSGVDYDLRRHTRTATDLTATLLMQNGDCRETMYLNGALFACWQQIQVKKCIAKAMLCLDLAFEEGFQRIMDEEIPALMRYQLRGGQVAVYVEALAMQAKYQAERVSATDPTARLRVYGLDEVRAGQPLTCYELENAKLEVTYLDGSTCWIEPKDALAGWQPMAHTPASGGGVPIIPNLEQVKSIRLLNLVEDHALTFLYKRGDDGQAAQVEFCDGFYNQLLFDSPYAFGAGPVQLADISTGPGLLRAGNRIVLHPDGSRQSHPVYLQFLHFSQTDYEAALVEGDIPGTIQLMGRTFSGNLQRERRRLEEGASPIPALLEKIQQWQLNRQQTTQPDRKQIEQQVARLILDLARHHPEWVELKAVNASQPLITEAVEQHNVYLVLSGELTVYRQGEPLRDEAGNPVRVVAGSILGEISALRDGVASATVAGDAGVLSLTQAVIRQQAASNPMFRQSLEALAGYRIL